MQPRIRRIWGPPDQTPVDEPDRTCPRSRKIIERPKWNKEPLPWMLSDFGCIAQSSRAETDRAIGGPTTAELLAYVFDDFAGGVVGGGAGGGVAGGRCAAAAGAPAE